MKFKNHSKQLRKTVTDEFKSVRRIQDSAIALGLSSWLSASDNTFLQN